MEKHEMKNRIAMNPYSSQMIPFQFASARIEPVRPIGSRRPMIETNVVSLNNPMKVETIPGMDIFNA